MSSAAVEAATEDEAQEATEADETLADEYEEEEEEEEEAEQASYLISWGYVWWTWNIVSHECTTTRLAKATYSVNQLRLTQLKSRSNLSQSQMIL